VKNAAECNESLKQSQHDNSGEKRLDLDPCCGGSRRFLRNAAAHICWLGLSAHLLPGRIPSVHLQPGMVLCSSARRFYLYMLNLREKNSWGEISGIKLYSSNLVLYLSLAISRHLKLRKQISLSY
jgi:hypothetical protein